MRPRQLAALLAVLVPGAAWGAKCAVSEKMLMGAWTSASGGFFEEMAFERDGDQRVFNSWLHHRPEISGGSWRVEDCVVHIRHASEDGLTFAYRLVRIKDNRLHLRDDRDGTRAVYKRVKP